MKLSSRLGMVASFISAGNIVADIGTDHGYIPIYQVTNGFSPFAYACDVNEGPLKRAADNVALYGVEDKVKLVLSNGLHELGGIERDVPESIVIAGMGGMLINRILDADMNIAQNAKELILSPHSEMEEVRHFLIDNNFGIMDEEMVYEDGKYYTVLKCAYGHVMNCVYEDKIGYMFGGILLSKKHPVLNAYLIKENDTAQRIINNLELNGAEKSKARLSEIREKKSFIERALENWR